MNNIYWVWKPIGWSPKKCADTLKKEISSLKTEKNSISYAARLDPMAYGIMPIVVANKNDITEICQSLQTNYKTYRFNVISGVTTDSYDILGIPTIFTGTPSTISSIVNKNTQLYPVYSSRTILDPDTGKMEKMFNMKNMGKDVIRPEHPVDIKYIKCLGENVVSNGELWSIITKRLAMLVETGFRIDEIRTAWISLLFKYSSDGHFQSDESRAWTIATYEAYVGPGTYIRCIANDLGGTAYDICRIEMSGNNYMSPNAKNMTDIIDKFIVL